MDHPLYVKFDTQLNNKISSECMMFLTPELDFELVDSDKNFPLKR